MRHLFGIPLERIFPFRSWSPMVSRRRTRRHHSPDHRCGHLNPARGRPCDHRRISSWEYGLYSAIVALVIAASFGSSFHTVIRTDYRHINCSSHDGWQICNAIKSGIYQIVLTLTFLVGFFQIGLGLARLGSLVNLSRIPLSSVSLQVPQYVLLQVKCST